MIDLAETLVNEIENSTNQFHTLYNVNDTIENKINAIETEIYGALGVEYAYKSKKQLK